MHGCVRDQTKRKLFRWQVRGAADDCHQIDFDPKLTTDPIWYNVKWESGGAGPAEEKGDTEQ